MPGLAPRARAAHYYLISRAFSIALSKLGEHLRGLAPGPTAA
jgi:hypothetical protein